jgi:hypothetical protein
MLTPRKGKAWNNSFKNKIKLVMATIIIRMNNKQDKTNRGLAKIPTFTDWIKEWDKIK